MSPEQTDVLGVHRESMAPCRASSNRARSPLRRWIKNVQLAVTVAVLGIVDQTVVHLTNFAPLPKGG